MPDWRINTTSLGNPRLGPPLQIMYYESYNTLVLTYGDIAGYKNSDLNCKVPMQSATYEIAIKF
jgi:hypothetical protein